jgi:hypothetical protein
MGTVFMDIDTIPIGEDFTEVVREALSDCDIMLTLIGLSWLDASDKAGKRRLDDPGDYLRVELEHALRTQIRLIPVLIQGAGMPEGRELPQSLVELAHRNAFELSDRRWRADVDTLCNAFPVPGQVAPTKADRTPIESRLERTNGSATETMIAGQSKRRVVAAAGTATLILCSILLAALLVSKPSASRTNVTIDRVMKVDRLVTVTGGGTQTTPPISTTEPSELVVAMVSTEYEQSIEVSGGGLSWVRAAQYTGTPTTAGEDIELWTARGFDAGSHFSITSTMTGPGRWLQSLTVMAFKRAAGLGAIAQGCHSASGCTSRNQLPSVALTASHTGSIVVGVGYDYSDYITKSVVHGQTLDQEAFDDVERATMWVQHVNAPTKAGSPAAVTASPAPNDNWALVAFEVVPGITGTVQP